jgi:hypothetical protein
LAAVGNLSAFVSGMSAASIRLRDRPSLNIAVRSIEAKAANPLGPAAETGAST